MAIVDVTADEAEAIRLKTDLFRFGNGILPDGDEDVYWLAAVIRKAHNTKCNPGGEIQCHRIDEAPLFPQMSPMLPRFTLLSERELRDKDLL